MLARRAKRPCGGGPTATWRFGLVLALALAVAMSAMAAPPQRPVQRIFNPSFFDDSADVTLNPQEFTKGPVGNRQRDYAAPGIKAGGFIMFPKLEIDEDYNDNIFATKTDRESDFATVITPSVSIQSLWSRHGLGVQAFGQFSEFVEHGTENTQQGGLNVTGRFDITSNDSLSGFASYSHEAEPHSERDDEGTRHPVLFDRFIGLTRYAHQFNRLELTVDGQVQRFNFAAERDADRDRTEIRVDPRLTYDASSNLRPFLQFGYLDRNFDDPVEADSQTYAALAGLRVDLGATLEGEVSAGVFHTDFDDPTLDPVTAPALEGELTWQVTRLTTVTGTLSRRIAATTQSDTSSKIVSAVSVRVEHELLRNLVLSSEIGYRNEEFEGSSRVDNRIDVEVGGSYLLNRNAVINFGYVYATRDSTDDTEDFDNNIIRLGVDLKM